MPSGSVLKEPPQKSESNQAHISLVQPFTCWSSKLSATYKNTETKRELLAGMREKTQVSLSNVRFGANKLHPSPAATVRRWTVADQEWTVRIKLQLVREKSLSLDMNSFTESN